MVHLQKYVSSSEIFLQMPNYCIVCGLFKNKDPTIPLYRIPKWPAIQKLWLEGLGLTQHDVNAESPVCSKHFQDGNPKTVPSVHLGTNLLNVLVENHREGNAKRLVSYDSTIQSVPLCIQVVLDKISPLPDPLVASLATSSRECSDTSSISLI